MTSPVLFNNSTRPLLSGRVFLVTYRPLGATGMGRAAVLQHDAEQLRWYVDHSCRREPDLSHSNPMISGLCRKEKFVPRLRQGDLVAYLVSEGGRYRLPALLHVIRTVDNHEAAAELYQEAKHGLPGNCMVDGNRPLELGMTGGQTGQVKNMKRLLATATPTEKERAIRQWDAYYRGIIRQDGVTVAAITEPLFISLSDPPAATSAQLIAAFGAGRGGGVPGTQTPSGKHSLEQLDHFLHVMGIPDTTELYRNSFARNAQ